MNQTVVTTCPNCGCIYALHTDRGCDGGTILGCHCRLTAEQAVAEWDVLAAEPWGDED